MKNLFRLFFVIFSIFFFVSCGGDESNSEEEGASFSFRMMRDAESECSEMELECLTLDISAIAFKITTKTKNGDDKTVPINGKPGFSISRQQLKDFDGKVKGIEDATNATLMVSVFTGTDSTGQPNVTYANYEGRATGLNFKKGKTTKADILLYPVAPRAKELEMPKTKNLAMPRFGHTSTVLSDKRVLVAGGFVSCGDSGQCAATDSVEIIDIESGEIEPLIPMTTKRAMHTAIPLNDGSVLFIGGVQDFSAKQQETAFDGYPLLPYVQKNAVTTIEKYMPSQPTHNRKINNSGTSVENKTETITVPEEIKFMTFQSIFVKQTLNDEENNIAEFDVFLVGGVDAEGKPSKKTYKLTITDSTVGEGTVSVSTVTEFAETSSPMILPAIAYSNGSILAVGGRPAPSAASTRDTTEDETTDETTEETTEEPTAESGSTGVVASIISENESKDIEADLSSNIFFANSAASDNALYTLGGMPNKSGELTDSDQNGVIRKWNLSSGSFETPENNNGLSSNGKNVAFAKTILDKKNNRLIVVGGTSAENMYQVINAATLEKLKDPTSHYMTDKRIMPDASIIPAGTIGNNPILIITGGTSALNNNGSAANTIKINVL
ncbi:hypothetical protein IKS86_03285 [bacterium]|nr:hypothetical protein [bacterium]